MGSDKIVLLLKIVECKQMNVDVKLILVIYEIFILNSKNITLNWYADAYLSVVTHIEFIWTFAWIHGHWATSN